eukprot:1162088-Pelagomonas_calceolata.AAC.4
MMNTKDAIQLSNLDKGGLGWGSSARAAYRMVRHMPGRKADNPQHGLERKGKGKERKGKERKESKKE